MDRVMATLYQELRSMARRQLVSHRGHTLEATALVHEAYLKLIGRGNGVAQFDDRAHFFAYAASAMRSVVVHYARQRLAHKRGGNQRRVTDLTEDIEGGVLLAYAQPGDGDIKTRKAAWLARAYAAELDCARQPQQAAQALDAVLAQMQVALPEGGAIPREIARLRADCGGAP